MNYYNINKNNDTIHAEVNCIQNLKKFKHKKKLSKAIKVNIIVLRTNPKGNELLMAKPCCNCAKYLEKNLYVNGFKLNNIFYTDKNEIIKMK